jgi:hypothetical protein
MPRKIQNTDLQKKKKKRTMSDYDVRKWSINETKHAKRGEALTDGGTIFPPCNLLRRLSDFTFKRVLNLLNAIIT